MAEKGGLSGSLKAIALPTLLQMISQDRKSGVFQLQKDNKGYEVLFSSGQVVMAKPLGMGNIEHKSEFLVRRGVVSSQQVITVRQQQESTMQTFETIIIAAGMAEQNTIKKAWQLETEEAIYDMLAWEEGDYLFTPQEVKFNVAVQLPQSIDGLLMEGMRIKDETPRLLKDIGAFDKVPFKKIADEELTEAHIKKLKSLPESQQAAYSHIDDRSSIQEIGYRTGLGGFGTAQALAGLLANKIIQLGDAETLGDIGEQAEMRQISRSRQFFVSAGAIIVVLFLALSAVRLSGVSLHEIINPPKRHRVGKNWKRLYLSTNQLERLKNAIEIFRIEKGRLPDRLTELVDADLLNQSDLTFPFKKDYYYKKKDNRTYLILRPAE